MSLCPTRLFCRHHNVVLYWASKAIWPACRHCCRNCPINAPSRTEVFPVLFWIVKQAEGQMATLISFRFSSQNFNFHFFRAKMSNLKGKILNVPYPHIWFKIPEVCCIFCCSFNELMTGNWQFSEWNSRWGLQIYLWN